MFEDANVWYGLFRCRRFHPEKCFAFIGLFRQFATNFDGKTSCAEQVTTCQNLQTIVFWGRNFVMLVLHFPMKQISLYVLKLLGISQDITLENKPVLKINGNSLLGAK